MNNCVFYFVAGKRNWKKNIRFKQDALRTKEGKSFPFEEELEKYFSIWKIFLRVKEINNRFSISEFSSGAKGKRCILSHHQIKVDHSSTSISVVILKIEWFSFVAVVYPFFPKLLPSSSFWVSSFLFFSLVIMRAFNIFFMFRLVNRMNLDENCTVCSNSSSCSHSHSHAYTQISRCCWNLSRKFLRIHSNRCLRGTY